MLYIFIVCILALPANLTSGPTCSKQKIHDNHAANEICQDSNSPTPANTPQRAPELYFSITIQEFNKKEYNAQRVKYAQNADVTLQPLQPLARLTTVYSLKKDPENKLFHTWSNMSVEGNIEFLQEEDDFIYDITSITTSPGGIIHCRPTIKYTSLPKDRVRFMTVTCPHDLNPNFQASNS